AVASDPAHFSVLAGRGRDLVVHDAPVVATQLKIDGAVVSASFDLEICDDDPSSCVIVHAIGAVGARDTSVRILRRSRVDEGLFSWISHDRDVSRAGLASGL